MSSTPQPLPPPRAAMLRRKDLLAGAMFMSVALLGLWLSHDYPLGTAVRMGTGYVPRLLCWVLLALGAAVALTAFRSTAPVLVAAAAGRPNWRPLVFVTTPL